MRPDIHIQIAANAGLGQLTTFSPPLKYYNSVGPDIYVKYYTIYGDEIQPMPLNTFKCVFYFDNNDNEQR